MQIPEGYLGYFNTLQLFNGTNSEWGMQVFFNENGQGTIDGGGEGAASFNFDNDTRIFNEIIIDMNNDWAEYKLDGNSIHGWQWSIGSFGQSSLNQLGGVNFFAWAGKGKGTPKYYFDDFKIEEFGGILLMPPVNFNVNVAFDNIQLTWEEPSGNTLTGYSIYYAYDGGDFNLLANTEETSYIVESPGNGLHAYYLTAVYDEGESEPTNIEEILLTGMDEFESDRISVFPNPASNFVVLRSDEPISSVRLYDYTGKILWGKSMQCKIHKIDISKLKPGIYLLLMETGSKSVSRQIIKK
jgi:hypothetical protein